MAHSTLEQAVRPLLTKGPVEKIIQKSVRGLELMIRDGRFPKRFYLSDRRPRWRAEDVESWLAQKATDAQAESAVQ